MRIKVLLVDDHNVLRTGLRLLIESQEDMEVVGEVSDGKEVLDGIARLKPDVLVLDLSMPGVDGFHVIEGLRARQETTYILVLTMYEEEEYLRKAIEAGANGYILKSAVDTELLKSIREVAKGRSVIDPIMAGKLVTRFWSPNQGKNENSPVNLSPRETEVLRFIALGYTNSQIGDKLAISTKTVESHKASIKVKLKAQKRSELVRYAMEHKLI